MSELSQLTPFEEIDRLRDQLQVTAPMPPPTLRQAGMGELAGYALAIIHEYARRFHDTLDYYLPLPEVVPFHESKAQTRLLAGGNRSSKTTGSCFEIARLFRGKDPYHKRAASNLRMMAVGYDGDHIGDTMWQKLWWPGLIQLIPDEKTGRYRSVRPDPLNPAQLDPVDEQRRELWKPAPPLIPVTCLKGGAKGIGWEKKNQNIPRKVYGANGSIILFFSSKGAPRAGFELDVAWFDEGIDNAKWYAETMARLTQRSGIFVWSFLTEDATPLTWMLHKRAVAGDELVEEFHTSFENNPYVPADAKRAFYENLKHDPDDLRVRYYGEYAVVGRQVYPMWSMAEFGVAPFEIPDDWMRIGVIDPGVTNQAAAVFAVDPEARQIHLVHELVVRNQDAEEVATQFKRLAGQWMYEDFIIDRRASMQHAMGAGRGYSVYDHYSASFAKIGLSSRVNGYGFTLGNDDWRSRELSLKRWMKHKILKVHTDCKNFDKQMQARHNHKTRPDRREEKTRCDMCDITEYCAAYFDSYRNNPPSGLFYHAPQQAKGHVPNARKWLKFLKHQKARIRGEVGGMTLGPVSTGA